MLQYGHRNRGGAGLTTEVLPDLERATSRHRRLGHTWYVDSTLPASGDGNSWGSAYSTIQAAVNVAKADDAILVAPGHVETITAAAGLVINKAGLTIVGFGSGNRCPQINFTTATTADMDITAAGVTLINVRFTGGIDALAGPVHIAAADCTLIDCVTEDVTDQATDFIVATAAADRLSLIRWTHRGAAAAGAESAITILGGDQITIEDPWIDGNFGTACIENVTAAATNCRIYGGASRPGYLRTRNADDIAITMVSTATGDIGPYLYIRLQDDAQNITECLVGADMQFYDPVEIVNADGQSSIASNITASTDA
jgi:hypothetical protein